MYSILDTFNNIILSRHRSIVRAIHAYNTRSRNCEAVALIDPSGSPLSPDQMYQAFLASL